MSNNKNLIISYTTMTSPFGTLVPLVPLVLLVLDCDNLPYLGESM